MKKRINRWKKLTAIIISFISSPASAGSDISITAGVWNWVGSGDFLVSENWQFGPLFGGPVNNPWLDIRFGPVLQLVNGLPAGFTGSSAPATLSSDFTSTGALFMNTGYGNVLTIQNATYTYANALIGTLPDASFSGGAGNSVTVNLDNGNIVGSTTVGVDSSGVLNVVGGNSSLTGNLTLAQSVGSSGALNIASGANFNLNGQLIVGSGTAAINNQGTFSSASSLSGVGVFTNGAGATYRKTGTGQSTIGWDVINNGQIDVQEGTLSTGSGNYSGNGSATIASGAELRLSGKLIADAALAVNGNGKLDLEVTGDQVLALSGNYTVGQTSNVFRTGTLGARVTNSGAAILEYQLSSTSSALNDVEWRNLSGGSLELKDTATFSLGFGGAFNKTLINDSGATLSKTGTGQSTIGWDVVNNGLIDVQGGILSTGTSRDYSGNGSANIASGAELRLGGKLIADAALAVNGGGKLDLDITGDQVLALSGNYTVGQTSNVFRTGTLGARVTNSGAAILEYQLSSTSSALNDVEWRNLSGGSLELKDTATFSLGFGGAFNKTLINDNGATLSKTGTGQSTIGWDVVNNGLIDVQEGALAVSSNVNGSGSVNISANATLTINSTEFQAKTITVDPNGTFDFNGSRLEVIDFTGDLDQKRGVFAPGASPAVSSLDGDYNMSGSSIFEIEIAGTETGLFDQLFVSGDVNISSGSLSVALLDGFVITPNISLDILIVDGLFNGAFNGLGEGALVGNFGEDLFITYLAGDGNDIALYSAVSAVPVPAAVWLFGSGLMGLLGMAKRKR